MNTGVRNALLVVALVGCGDTLDATQIMVIIDAEPGVRAQAEQLHVLVEGSGGRAGLNERAPYDRTFTQGDGTLVWPHRTALAPLDADIGRVYTFTATALDANGKFVAQARAISGYVEHKALALPLLLEDRCLSKVCSDRQTCAGGICGDAKIDSATLLPLGSQPAHTVGGSGGSGGAGGDAMLPMPDAGGALNGGSPAVDGGAGGVGPAGQDAGPVIIPIDGGGGAAADAGLYSRGETCDPCRAQKGDADCAPGYTCRWHDPDATTICMQRLPPRCCCPAGSTACGSTLGCDPTSMTCRVATCAGFSGGAYLATEACTDCPVEMCAGALGSCGQYYCRPNKSGAITCAEWRGRTGIY